MNITFRRFMQIVRNRHNVGSLRKVEKYSGKPYRAGYSDLPAWKGRTAEGEPVYVTKETGERDYWLCQIGDDWSILTPVNQ